MQDRDIIHNYLNSFSKYLSRLEKADADEVIREIESHIYDALEAQEAEGQAANAETILVGFGKPRELAAQYVEHILVGAPPPTGFKAIQRVRKGVTSGLYFATGILGYCLSLAAIFLGLYKLFYSQYVGVWSTPEGKSFTISIRDHPYDMTNEMMGWWLVPIAIGFGIGAGYLTKRLLGVLKEQIRR